MSKDIGMVMTLAEMQDFYRADIAGAIIELMNKTNDILNDIKFMESNQSDGHLTRIRTGLPEVHWRRLYRGTPYSKSQWAQVKEMCSMMEARMLIDEKEASLYGDNANKFRMSEGVAFMEAMRQRAAATLFYGNSDVNPDEFKGLSMRYPSKDSPNMVDAGGTAAGKCTSAWLISWGERTAHGLYPKGSKGGLEHTDLGRQTINDDTGNPFEALVSRYQWNLGLAVRDWRACVRVANIPVENLAKRRGQAGFIDLQQLFIAGKNKMPETMRQSAIWYANEELMNAIELQSTDAGNIHLVYGEAFKSDGTPLLFGRPVRQCDAIKSTEDPLAAK